MKATPWSTNACKAVLVLFLLLASGLQAASAGGLAPDLEKKVQKHPNSGETLRVIVQFSDWGFDHGALARLAEGRLVKDHPSINGSTFEIPTKMVRWLSKHPKVGWISPDRNLGAEWDYGPQAIGADQVWTSPGFQGSGVRVAVLDTGVAGNPADLNFFGTSTSRVVAWQDCVNGGTVPYDDNGHGTHVAGIIAGNGSNSNSFFKGVAPAAELVCVKVLDSSGAGAASNVIAGIDWCIANKSALNLRAMNLSLGHDPAESFNTDPLCAAVRRAVRAGIVVVCSAGNKGKDLTGVTMYGGISCPGNDPNVITVGALNTFGTIARADDGVCTYSSRGPTYIDQAAKPDLVAPGNKVVSLRASGSYLDNSFPANRVAPSSYGSNASTPSYYVLSGTSMAAPMATGTVALVLQANPGLRPNAVKGILMYTAQKLNLVDSLGVPLAQGLSILTQGAGSLNVAGAVETATKLDTTVPVGSRWLRSALSGRNTMGGHTWFWGAKVNQKGKILGGDDILGVRQVLWGDDPVTTPGWGDQVTWGGQVTWGDDMVPQDQVIWSNATLWGDPSIWGEDCMYADAYVRGIDGD
jgi:serine protease AprX